MNWLITDLEKAYSMLKTSIGGISLILLASLIGISICISQFYNEYKNLKAKEGAIDAKALFDLSWQYVTCFIVIVCLPFVIYGIEKVLGEFQSKVVNMNSNTLNFSIDEAAQYFEREYTDKQQHRGAFGIAAGVFGDMFKNAYYIFALYAAKHTFTMFAAGRYVYLMMLELMAPVAIVMALSEKTLPYFYTFVKHFIICYLMLPFFILASIFADLLIDAVFTGGQLEWMNFSKLGFIGVTMTFILKIYLFKFVQDKLFRLI